MIEIRHLHALIALAETGNLSKAGRRLHLSQPALSHQVKSIETHLGVPLFERKSSPIRLSPAGERLLGTAHEIVKQMRQCERDVARIAEGKAGQLRIAVECHSCFDWLMPAMDEFRIAWPEVEMDLVSGFQPDPTGLLIEDQADLVIVSKAPARKDVVYHPLFRYEVLALLAHQHPLTRKRFLTAQDFAKETLITYPIPDDRIDVVREVLGPLGLEANANALARYAALCQEVGLVPIVEPEVLMTGEHTLERCYNVTREVLRTVFIQLNCQRVLLEGMILKPNMVLPGLSCPTQVSVDEVADATVNCLLQTVPAAVPGIAFLSGGQSAKLASARLNAMSVRFKSRAPWALAFSFARAIQQPALEIWRGDKANVEAAQQALLHRARCNVAARRGIYTDATEGSGTN